MPPLPKRRHSTRRQGKRRATIRLRLPKIIPCPKCQEPKISHQVCPKCGAYQS